MNLSYTDLLSDILSIAHYSDKEKFVREFEQMNQLEAVENCIKKFPQPLQDFIMTFGSTPEEVLKHIDPDSYRAELLLVSAESLVDFLQHIQPALTGEQKEKIASILHNIPLDERVL